MATGDHQDITNRLLAFLPNGWFPSNDPTTRVYALQYGFAAALATITSQLAYVTVQTRVATATGAFVDLISWDFFQGTLPRMPGETDREFSLRIRQNVFLDRNTRPSIDAAVFNLTGIHPQIIESWRPADTGGYDTNGLFFDALGCWATEFCDFYVYVILPALVPPSTPTLIGWDDPGTGGGWDAGAMYWTGPGFGANVPVTILDICAAIERVRMAGTKVFLEFTGAEIFRLDYSNLDSPAVLD